MLVWLRFLLCYLCVCLSLDPPYNFFSFLQSLFFVCFLELSLKTVYPTSGKDGKRLQKVGKGGKRWESTASVLENTVFHVMLQTRACFLTAGSLLIVYLCCAVGK